jgi:hypothetical protein
VKQSSSVPAATQNFAKFLSGQNFHTIQILDVSEQGFCALQIPLTSAPQSRLNARLFSAVRTAHAQTESVRRACLRSPYSTRKKILLLIGKNSRQTLAFSKP